MQESRINRNASAAKNRNWRNRNDSISRFLSNLNSQSTINRRRTGSGNVKHISSQETSSTIRNGRIGVSISSNKSKVNGKRLTTSDFLRMQIDSNGDNSISLEEILLYVINIKSRNQTIPSAMYSLHPKFSDVVRSLELIDSDESLDIEDSEAARAIITSRAGELDTDLDMEVANFVLAYLNENSDAIGTAAETIDTNPDGEVSNIEVLAALLAGRRGELDISDPHIDTVLRTNESYDELLALVASMSVDFDGAVTDEQAFDIILALRASSPSDTVLQQALFLSSNENLATIEQSVAVFDSVQDGQISNDEFINIVKDMRAGSINEADHQIVMDILRSREPYASILAVIEAIDTEVDGSITDDEVIDFSLASLRGEFVLDPDLVETIINSNSRVETIRDLIARIDTEATNPGIISEDEFITAAFEILSDASLGPASTALVEKILNRNPNSSVIYQVINFVDSDNNNSIGREETINALLAHDRNETSSLDPVIFDKLLNRNPERSEIEALLNQINPARDGNPNLEELFDFVLNFKAGAITASEDLIRAIIASFPEAQAILETYELMDSSTDGIDLREYTTGLMQINQGLASNPGPEIMNKFTELVENAEIVNEAIATLDTIEVNGLISAEEFNQNFSQLFLRPDLTVDMDKLSVFMTVSDIIFPGAAALNQFILDVDTRVETPVNIISDTEVIDALLNLNNGSIADPGEEIVDLVLSRNPNKVELSNLVQTIDTDNDGAISDTELGQNLLKLRRGELSGYEPGLVQYLLHTNPKFTEISAVIDAFDRDSDGTVSDLELFSELFANRSGSYAGLTDTEANTITTILKATNPNSAAIATAVENLDPDQSGATDYDELVAAYLAINSGAQSDFSDELKEAIPTLGGGTFGADALAADELVDLFDSDTRDGMISDIELAAMILSDRADGTLSSYDPELVEAIFRNNGNKDRIETLIAELDGGDGVIDRSDLVSAILSQRADASTFGSDYPLVEMILAASNDEFNSVKSIIEEIDTTDEGEISAQEAMNTLVAIGRSEYTGIDIELANAVIDSNPDISAIRTAFEDFGIDFEADDLTIELFTTWIAIQQGLTPPDYFNELIIALGPDSDISVLITQFQEIDTDSSNNISPAEYGQLMIDIVTGSKDQTEYQLLIDALADDPALSGIRDIVNSFNPEGDTNFSDENILEGILNLYASGQAALVAEGYVQAILAQNSDSNGIIKLLAKIDPGQSGIIERSRITEVWQDVINEKSAIPQNLEYDFNNDGLVDNKDKETVINLLNYINTGQEFTVLH